MPDPRRNPMGPGRGRDDLFDNRLVDNDGPIDEPIENIRIVFNVTSWPDDRLIGRDSVQVQISGTAKLVIEILNEDIDTSTSVQRVEVRLGDSEFQQALTGFGNFQWTFIGDVTREAIGSPTGGQLSMTARAVSGSLRQVRHHTVNVVFDHNPPELTITQPEPGEMMETSGPPYDIIVRGTASDFKMELVECGLDENSLEPARNLVGDWDRWRKDMALPEIGKHEIVVRAWDRAGNVTTDSVTVEVHQGPPLLTFEDSVGGISTEEWSEEKGLTFEMVGEASDVGSSVKTVGWTFDGTDIHEAEDLSGSGDNDWSRWSAPIRIPSADTEEVVIRAEDEVGLVTEKTLTSNAIWQLFFQALMQNNR